MIGPMDLEVRDLQTETFSNAKGWTVVRVTHVPTSLAVERTRSDALRSAVRAQQECMTELDRLLSGELPQQDDRGDEPVTRAEFEALAARVARLESRLA